MNISSTEVEKIAVLARLSLSEEEKEIYAGQLGNILDFIAKLEELDTSNVSPTSHVTGISNVTRPDDPSKCLTQEDALLNAPDASGGFYRVPKIIE